MRLLTLNCTRTHLPTSYLMPTSFIQTVIFLNWTARPNIQQPALEITCQGMAFNFCSCHRIHQIFELLRMCGRYSRMRLRRKFRKILTNLPWSRENAFLARILQDPCKNAITCKILQGNLFLARSCKEMFSLKDLARKCFP